MQFVVSETDEVLVSHSGLTLVGALLGRTQLRARLDALEVETCPRPTMPHGEVLVEMVGLLALGKSDYADCHRASPCGCRTRRGPSDDSLRSLNPHRR